MECQPENIAIANRELARELKNEIELFIKYVKKDYYNEIL